MRVQSNKFRQAANIFLTLALVCAAAGVFIYFFTTPEGRDSTFWTSIGLLLFAGAVSALFASRVVYSDRTGRQPPHTFAQLALASLYVVFVVGASAFNIFHKMSAVNYFLLHVAGGVVFLLPLQLLNMAALKSGADETRAAAEKIRGSLRDASARVQNVLSSAGGKLEAADAAKLRKLADNLLYSDPCEAPDKLERALLLSVDDLEARAELFLADPASAAARAALTEAADAAARALKARNDAVLRSR